MRIPNESVDCVCIYHFNGHRITQMIRTHSQILIMATDAYTIVGKYLFKVGKITLEQLFIA